MFKVTKVDEIPKKKRRTKSKEIIRLFDAFVASDDTAVLVESDKKYTSEYGLVKTLQAARNRYGYHSINVVARSGKAYLVKKTCE